MSTPYSVNYRLPMAQHAAAPCPVCHAEGLGGHFHVRVGTEIPARFTRCPNDPRED